MRYPFSVLALVLALGLVAIGCSGANDPDDDDDAADDDAADDDGADDAGDDDAGDDDTATADLVINELMADNDNVHADELGEYDDWVELKNVGSSDLDLDGYGLTDGYGEEEPWDFTAGTVIPAGGYLLVWCDDGTGDAATHADFKLSADGEELTLVGPGDGVVDQVAFPKMPTDLSYARDPDGTGAFVMDDTPTPEAEND